MPGIGWRSTGHAATRTDMLEYDSIQAGDKLVVRRFFGNKTPGSLATVRSKFRDENGNPWVRCTFGKNLSNKPIQGTMPLDCMGKLNVI